MKNNKDILSSLSSPILFGDTNQNITLENVINESCAMADENFIEASEPHEPPKIDTDIEDMNRLYAYVNKMYTSVNVIGVELTTLKTNVFTLTNKVNENEKILQEFKADIAGRTLGIESKHEEFGKHKVGNITNINNK